MAIWHERDDDNGSRMKPEFDNDRRHESTINDTLARFLRDRCGLSVVAETMFFLVLLALGIATYHPVQSPTAVQFSSGTSSPMRQDSGWGTEQASSRVR